MCRALFQAPGNLSDREKSLPLWSLRSGGTPLFVSLGTGLQAPADQTRPHSPAPGELISAASIQKPFSQDPALGAHRSLQCSTIVELSVSTNISVSFGFMYFGALLFSNYLLSAYYISVIVQGSKSTVAIEMGRILSLRLTVG